MNFGVYLLIGVFSGTTAGLLGLGGGIIIVPALAFVFAHYNFIPHTQVMHMAIGTSLATIIVTLLASLVAHTRHESVKWHLVKFMWPWLLIGACLGALIANFLPTYFLRVTFSFFLFYTSAKIIFARTIEEDKPLPSPNIIRAVSIGAGSLSGILGVGAGATLIPFFLHCKLTIREAAGTAVATGIVISLMASASFMLLGWSTVHLPWSTGYVYWPAFLGIGLTSIFFAPLGAYLAYKLPATPLKFILAVFLFLIGIDMLW